jgi:hypothetical protein
VSPENLPKKRVVVSIAENRKHKNLSCLAILLRQISITKQFFQSHYLLLCPILPEFEKKLGSLAAGNENIVGGYRKPAEVCFNLFMEYELTAGIDRCLWGCVWDIWVHGGVIKTRSQLC